MLKKKKEKKRKATGVIWGDWGCVNHFFSSDQSLLNSQNATTEKLVRRPVECSLADGWCGSETWTGSRL